MTTYLAIEERVAHLDEERARGDAFERVIAHLLRHDPVLGMRRVWTWLDWPGRRAVGIGPVDLGIDLVAEDDQGQLVGVQVKHRLDPHSHLRWEEISTALGFRPDLFARRLVVTNAADRTANARKATAMTPNTGWVLRADLLASPIDWTGALEAGTGAAAPVLVRRQPRPYQSAAVADVVASLGNHERTQLIMACGSGKTLVTLWIAEARADERILVLVPTLLLLKQFRREWRQAAALPFVDLAVCSDADTVEPDEWVVRADELGVPVTTDPAVIATFLQGLGRRVVFATYASSARVAEAQASAGVPAFDLVVADEAHRIAGIVNTGVHKERDLRVVLDGDRIRASRRLFATATPRVYGRAVRARFDDLEDVQVASMDDETLFGPVAHRLWFRAAVDLGVLTDYQLIAVLVTDAEVADLVRERTGVIVDGKVLDAETLATLIAIRRAIDELKLTRAISFHHTIARARGFAHALSGVPLTASAPDAEHISGAMSVDERERILQVLKDPARPTVVTNARCLTEGIDVPSLDAVAFVDPRSSAVDIVQAVGRVMRRAKGKDRGYVVVPVFLGADALADPEAAVASTAFAKVLDVLRALRAHDPDLTSDATRIPVSLGAREAVAGGHIADQIRLLGVGVDAGRFERALKLHFVEIAVDRFEVALAALRAFVEREGHARVPVDHVEGGIRLGEWVNHRRVLQRSGRLDPRQAVVLASIPGWIWEPLTFRWDRTIRALREYATREGHARVPDGHVEGDIRLGEWVVSRRIEHDGRRLSSDRAAELEALPGWSWDPIADDWDSMTSALRAYAAREGHARVSADHVEGELRLGSWVAGQRTKRRAGLLDAGRVAELAEIRGWTWDPRADAWTKGLAALRGFAAREGHIRVPRGFVEAGVDLGSWVLSHRSRRDRLDTARIAELDAIPGWTWDPYRDAWEEALAALRAFVAREGHTRVARDHVEAGVRLERWVIKRRAARNAGRLDPARIAELDDIPGWTWDPYDDNWEAGLEALRTFVAREGHAKVPQRHVEGQFRLGIWVSGRRVDRNRGRLDSARVALLDDVPGWTWDSQGDGWAANLASLRAFVERAGHARVPALHVEDGVRLGSWVAVMRRQHRLGSLDADRAASLTALSGWTWDPVADDWSAMLATLRSFARREGHARVPYEHVEDGLRLGHWVYQQRAAKKAGRLDAGRIAELLDIPGWTWDRRTDDWAANLTAIRAFIAREGHALVPRGHVEAGLPLGSWVSSRRAEQRRGALDAARAAELGAISGWTWAPPIGGRRPGARVSRS